MNEVFSPLLSVLLSVRFDERDTTHEEANLRLGKEYVRRAALWSRALSCEECWPFFDLVRRIDEDFDLPESVDAALSAHLGKIGMRTVMLLRAAVRWQAYQPQAALDTADLPDLYAPVVAMYQRHGEITAEHHMILTPIMGFRKQPLAYYLDVAPYMTDEDIAALPRP